MTKKLDPEIRLLAAMAYGESSAQDDEEEMAAIASVLVRQRDRRGYKNMEAFVNSEPSFSFVVNDGNPRFKTFINATAEKIENDAGMSAAVAAARNALNGGFDESNGAYFWDGADIKKNYRTHFEVKHGIQFSDVAHNIYGIEPSKKVVIMYKVIRIRNARTGDFAEEKTEIGRFDHVYVSTAAFGGTIFWKLNPEYLKATRAKEYR